MSDDLELPVLSYAPVILKLLQGPLYDEDTKLWALLGENTGPIREWFARIGLRLMLVTEEGLAYLTQPEEEEGSLPRLVKRAPLGYDATVLAVVLRDALEEFDLTNTDSRDLFMTARDIQARLVPYTGGRFDEARAWKQFERSLTHMVKLGFLRETPSTDPGDQGRKVYQVMRILKVKLGPSQLDELKTKLAAYRPEGGA